MLGLELGAVCGVRERAGAPAASGALPMLTAFMRARLVSRSAGARTHVIVSGLLPLVAFRCFDVFFFTLAYPDVLLALQCTPLM